MKTESLEDNCFKWKKEIKTSAMVNVRLGAVFDGGPHWRLPIAAIADNANSGGLRGFESVEMAPRIRMHLRESPYWQNQAVSNDF